MKYAFLVTVSIIVRTYRNSGTLLVTTYKATHSRFLICSISISLCFLVSFPLRQGAPTSANAALCRAHLFENSGFLFPLSPFVSLDASSRCELSMLGGVAVFQQSPPFVLCVLRTLSPLTSIHGLFFPFLHSSSVLLSLLSPLSVVYANKRWGVP